MAAKKTAFNLETCVRPNILKLQPYRCARDDYKDDGTNILLDANENAHGPGLHLSSQEANGLLANGNGGPASAHVDLLGLNRYPDPHQIELKQLWCNLRNSDGGGVHSSTPLTPDNLFIGVGSDEAIDATIRCFCAPGRDKILTCPPTYGMYSVSACVNDVEVVREPLDTDARFQLRPDAINAALARDPAIKVVYVCSPGNPTGELVRKEDVRRILEHPTWNGVVVVDEAYVDFASDPAASLATWVPEWPNLIVMQTLSKAFGLAGIRVGAAIAHPAVARIFNSFKAPYNVSSPASALAIHALQPEGLAVSRRLRAHILAQRERLLAELPAIPGVGRVRGGATAANFLLVEVLGPAGRPSNEAALAAYERLAEARGVIVRFRGKEHGCLGCLRITIGTEREMDRFLADFRAVLAGILQEGSGHVRQVDGKTEERQEKQANAVLA